PRERGRPPDRRYLRSHGPRVRVRTAGVEERDRRANRVALPTLLLPRAGEVSARPPPLHAGHPGRDGSRRGATTDRVNPCVTSSASTSEGPTSSPASSPRTDRRFWAPERSRRPRIRGPTW